jgi:hypothetical protein
MNNSMNLIFCILELHQSCSQIEKEYSRRSLNALHLHSTDLRMELFNNIANL